MARFDPDALTSHPKHTLPQLSETGGDINCSCGTTLVTVPYANINARTAAAQEAHAMHLKRVWRDIHAFKRLIATVANHGIFSPICRGVTDQLYYGLDETCDELRDAFVRGVVEHLSVCPYGAYLHSDLKSCGGVIAEAADPTGELRRHPQWVSPGGLAAQLAVEDTIMAAILGMSPQNVINELIGILGGVTELTNIVRHRRTSKTSILGWSQGKEMREETTREVFCVLLRICRMLREVNVAPEAIYGWFFHPNPHLGDTPPAEYLGQHIMLPSGHDLSPKNPHRDVLVAARLYVLYNSGQPAE